MPFSLYKILDLNKFTPTEISLQMADKSTAIPIGICEDVPVVVANVTICTDFVILDIPEDDSMSIILGRPDRGKGVPSFNEMMDIALVEVDFDDPTTNVRGRRALAIAKPTPRGY